MNTLSSIVKCRLCWRVALAVFLGIVIVEAAILVPSARNFERDLLVRLERVGLATIRAGFQTNARFEPGDLLIVGRLLTRHSEVRGGALYGTDGALLGTFGEAPETTLAAINDGAESKVRRAGGDRYEIFWPADETGLPYGVVGRLDSSWIRGEVNAFIWRIIGLVLLISVVVTGATQVTVGRLVLAPMLELRRNLVAAGDDAAHPERCELRGGRADELGEMFTAFNGMLERIARNIMDLRAREDALSRVNEELDRRVAKRTAALAESEARYRELFEQTPIGIWEENYSAVKRLIDKLRDEGVRDFRRYFEENPDKLREAVAAIKLLDVNRAVLGIYRAPDKAPFKRAEQDVESWAWSNIEDFYVAELSALAGGETRFVREFADQAHDGSEIVVRCTTHVPDASRDTWSRVVSTVEDITERKEAERRIEHLAYHDQLTGLPNRALFGDRLRYALAVARRRGEMLAVMFLDLDRFKEVNDTLGHVAGDEVLRTIAARLEETVRASDTVARLGGDEFAIIQANIADSDGSAVFAEKILAKVKAPLRVSGRTVYNTVTIGIALYPSDGETENELLQKADIALYEGKATGRESHRFFTPEMETALQERKSLEDALRKALEDEAFVLHYQPQVEIATGRIVGAEALLRWQHPERGLVLPAEFIPAAETSGVIRPLGEWVLTTACRQGRAWRDEGAPLRIAVNVSGAQFQGDDLERSVKRALKGAGIGSELLELEITETIMVERGVGATLARLSELGVLLSVDDFGTGYGSLTYLRRFPVSKIKVDRSFVGRMIADRSDAEIVRAVVGLGRNLNMRIVAEGVETEEQLAFLREAGCDDVQGYYFSPPLPPDEFAGLLSRGGVISSRRMGPTVPGAALGVDATVVELLQRKGRNDDSDTVDACVEPFREETLRFLREWRFSTK